MKQKYETSFNTAWQTVLPSPWLVCTDDSLVPMSLVLRLPLSSMAGNACLNEELVWASRMLSFKLVSQPFCFSSKGRARKWRPPQHVSQMPIRDSSSSGAHGPQLHSRISTSGHCEHLQTSNYMGLLSSMDFQHKTGAEPLCRGTSLLLRSNCV